ncbi:MAG: hypothetical protein ACRERU_23940 [Methylococcales bacterium]
MKKSTALWISFFLVFMNGCSTPVSHISVSPPARNGIQRIETVILHAGMEQVWNHVLSKVMESPFKIKNIDSASHILSVVISGNPSLYIDCGTKKIVTNRSVREVVNAAQSYEYSIYRQNHLDTYSISNQVNGKAILFVSGDARISSIRVKIDLELISSQQMSTTQGTFYGTSKRFTLNPSRDDQKAIDEFGTTCQSTGKFETEVRGLVDLAEFRKFER